MDFKELQTKINDKVELEDWGLDITLYLPLSQKAFILDGTDEEAGLIGNILKQDKDNLWYIDRYALDLNLVFTLCNWYGNITFNDNFTADDYDFVISSGLYEFLIKQQNDFFKLKDMLESMLEDEIEKRNSLSSIVAKLGNQLINKLEEMSDPKRMKQLMKQYEKAISNNPELLNLLKDQFSKVEGVLPKKVK